MLFLISCNSPPLYRSRAEDFLQAQEMEPDLISRLTDGNPLESSEIERLLAFGNMAVTHLVAANTSTPEPVLRQLAKHRNREVRIGVAINEAAPLEVLLDLRSPGRYSTVGCALARNSRVPQKVLVEMYRRGEATLSCFANNRRCPRTVMVEIVRKGDGVARTGLAINPGLPPDLYREMRKIPSDRVQGYLDANPAYKDTSDQD